jgi:hypothetical protein
MSTTSRRSRRRRAAAAERRKKKKAAKNVDGRTDGARSRPPGGTFDGADGKVLAYVRKHPASRLGEICEALDLKPWSLRASLDRLVSGKEIVVAGVGRGQRVSAKEAL